ncbi:hypothetical protein [Sporolactobacillus sp. KGMB 08714]|uniref:hypothetical protein n=1 Tax=Sporolactobacillus sp. KGMB 08714 TaxID=3064704 RepID=UPI002FBED98A
MESKRWPDYEDPIYFKEMFNREMYNRLVVSDPKLQAFAENSKDKILERIKSEGLQIRKSFKNSLMYPFPLYQYEHGLVVEQEINEIVLPQFTDDNVLIQTFDLAHELGHFEIRRNCKGTWKEKVLKSKNAVFLWFHERQAWRAALQILKEENIIQDKKSAQRLLTVPDKYSIVEDFGSAYVGVSLVMAMYEYERGECLSTYGKLMFNYLLFPIRLIWQLCLAFLKAFFTTGILWTFVQTGVPVIGQLDFSAHDFPSLVTLFFIFYSIETGIIWARDRNRRIN